MAPRDALGGAKAEAVVAAQRIAVADDQHRDACPAARRRASRRSTASIMRPSAWVEQLRQGSKARITASTRLSMPSESLLPWTKWRATCRTPRFMAALLWPVAMIRLAQVIRPSASTL